MDARAVELGLLPVERRSIPKLVVFLLLIGLFVAMMWSPIAQHLVAGLAIGGLSLVAQAVILTRLPRSPAWLRPVGVAVISALGGVIAVLVVWPWLGWSAATAAGLLGSLWLLLLAWSGARTALQLRRVRAFDLATATPDALDRFVAVASRAGPSAMFASVDVLYRGRRLTRALEVLRASRVEYAGLRADWLVHLHLELGDVAIAREVIDLAAALVRRREPHRLLDAQVRIAEGQAAAVLDELRADPPGASPRELLARWATRCDAMVAAGDLTGARATLAKLAAKDPEILARLAAGGRPCHELATQALAGDGAPFR